MREWEAAKDQGGPRYCWESELRLGSPNNTTPWLRNEERGKGTARQLLEARSSIKGKRRVRATRKQKYAAILRTSHLLNYKWISVLTDTLAANYFPQCMIGRLVLNLLKTRDTITVLHQFTTLTHLLSSLHEHFKYGKTVNVYSDNFQPFSSGGLTLPATHFAWINHISALHIVSLIPRAKDIN